MTKILVIEDEAPIRDKIVTVLEYEKYDVIDAPNGRDGVVSAQKYHPDLIICDVLMPDMNGYGALAALRDDPDTSDIPVIFLTAAASRADMRKGMELGADDYITKPYTVEELLTAVRTRLERQETIKRAASGTGEASGNGKISEETAGS
ncbi:MAG: response regulator [Rhodospirillaceae bacterium]|jgi:DNA-binding response OmpR family regulator|nr:response regulator [Rhodospirillaceae bacterium]MBT3925623.1 response regulator [Rhodospirillaceae bacterium]MBT4426508.1 response regulator [Rhodospirillaceae bacterium]MBT5037148.1 response regulator [Rhodospirillaceae bacterium]MBT5674626.1 response regulator [Rhodospirillaceae bacterium]